MKKNPGFALAPLLPTFASVSWYFINDPYGGGRIWPLVLIQAYLALAACVFPLTRWLKQHGELQPMHWLLMGILVGLAMFVMMALFFGGPRAFFDPLFWAETGVHRAFVALVACGIFTTILYWLFAVLKWR